MTVHGTLRKIHIFRYMNNFMSYTITKNIKRIIDPSTRPFGFLTLLLGSE